MMTAFYVKVLKVMTVFDVMQALSVMHVLILFSFLYALPFECLSLACSLGAEIYDPPLDHVPQPQDLESARDEDDQRSRL